MGPAVFCLALGPGVKSFRAEFEKEWKLSRTWTMSLLALWELRPTWLESLPSSGEN